MYSIRLRNVIMAAASVLTMVTSAGLGAVWSSSASAQCACGAPRPPAAARPVRINPGMPAQSGHAHRGPVRPPGIDAGARAARDAASGVRRQVANRTGPNNTPATEDGLEWESFGEAIDASVEDGQDEGVVWISFVDSDDGGSDDAEREGYSNSWSRDEAMSEEEFDDAELPEVDLSEHTDAEFSDAEFSDVEFSEEGSEGLDDGFPEDIPPWLAQGLREVRAGLAESKVLDIKVSYARAGYYIVKVSTFVAVARVGGQAFEAAVEGSYVLLGEYLIGRVVAAHIKATNDPSPHPYKRDAHLTAWMVTETIEISAELVGEVVGGPIGRNVLGMTVEAGLEYVNADDELTTALQGRNSTVRRNVGLRPVN